MKGQSWQIEETSKLILVMVVFVVSIFIIIGVMQSLSYYNCDNEKFKISEAGRIACPEYYYDEDFLIAKESTEQLICAIESTMEGQNSGCFEKGDASYGDVYVTCKFAGQPSLIAEPTTWQKAKSFFKSLFSKEADVPYGCQVHNFKLPQEVDVAEEWIAGYGDPKFLTYYESFPLGEERAWMSSATWMENVGTVVLFSFPASHFVKGVKGYVRGTIASIGNKITVQAKKGLSGLLTKLGVDRTKTEILLIEQGAEASVRRAAYADLGKQILDKMNYNQIVRGMKIAGVLTPEAFIAAWLDSTNEKFIREPNQMVLKQPYFGRKGFRLKWAGAPFGIEIDKPNALPIVLDKQGLVNKYIDKNLISFYLASPCDADLLVERSTVYCSSYEYTSDGGMICGFEDLGDACKGSIDYLENKGRIPTIDIPASKCLSSSDALDYIPFCGNDDTAEFNVVAGAVTGTNNRHCLSTAIKIKAIEKEGFCYSEPKSVTTPILIGTIVADGVLSYFSAGTLTHVSVGLTGGLAYVLAQQYENWP